MLDAARFAGGIGHARNIFYELCIRSRDSALRALNDDRLTFPTLYILRPEITKFGLEPYLPGRDSIALSISRQLISEARRIEFDERCLPVLQWMFFTGCRETCLGSEYDSIMDAAAALLIKDYDDTSCLRVLGDMIFIRHKAGLYTYDAEWAFFECGKPDCLAIIARRLLSSDAGDVMLARRLLKFLPCLNENITDTARQYRIVMQWLDNNKPYLYYTGESSLLCCEPCRFRVSYESKYLQKGVSELGMLSPVERIKLGEIAALDSDTKQMLCECSHVLYRSNKQFWHTWMQSPLYAKIETSRRIAGKQAANGYN